MFCHNKYLDLRLTCTYIFVYSVKNEDMEHHASNRNVLIVRGLLQKYLTAISGHVCKVQCVVFEKLTSQIAFTQEVRAVSDGNVVFHDKTAVYIRLVEKHVAATLSTYLSSSMVLASSLMSVFYIEYCINAQSR